VNGCEIVEATPDDSEEIMELDKFGNSEPRILEEYLSPIDPTMVKKYFILLAKIDGKAVAKVEIAIGERSEGSVAVLRRLVVHPSFRMRGIATELVRKAIDRAKIEGVGFVDLHVLENNAPAIRLYEKLGFEVRHKEIHFRKGIG
jgi:ribosomal protein S18 acetylase RimI-like enzyme